MASHSSSPKGQSNDGPSKTDGLSPSPFSKKAPLVKSASEANGSSSPSKARYSISSKQVSPVRLEDGAASTSGSSRRSNGSNGVHAKSGGRNIDPRIADARTKLPIWPAREAIAEAVLENDTVVVLGETGSGKTTQIPQFLFEAGLAGGLINREASSSSGGGGAKKRRPRKQMIGITQPRRVAAISLAKRVAVEMGVSEPDEGERGQMKKKAGPDGDADALVGYSVRFDDRSTRDTCIKFMTDGWLLRELLSGSGRPKQKEKGKRKEKGDGDVADDANEADPSHSLLEQYSVIVIDEAHERSVHTDVVLGLVKRVQHERKRLRAGWLARKSTDNGQEGPEPTELKVVVMSATIDADAFARFFSSPLTHEPAPILYIKGRQYPIQLSHAIETCSDWTESCKKLIVQINMGMAPGDVLVFMTGAEEIESFASDLKEVSKGMQHYALSDGGKGPPPSELMVVKLYAALGGEAIRKCFSATPPGCRKVVLATNIAETSITISGIKYVIDCGLAKERSFQTSMADGQALGTGIDVSSVGGAAEMLAVKAISKAAARQRAGRAGRESGGSCFRLYTSDTFDALPDATLPEILRTDLSSVVLDVFAMGLDPLAFDWLDRPDDDGWRAAVLNLVELGALDPVRTPASSSRAKEGPPSGHFRLTALGREMSLLPLLPSLSKTLLTARNFDENERVFLQALDLVSILSTERRTVLIEPSARIEENSGKVKGGTSKRDEADRARQRLAHPSGDHATQLQALYAFDEMEASCRTKAAGGNVSNGHSATNGTARVSIDHVRLKEWCTANYVSLKAVREAMRIRSQLSQVCKRQGWLPSSENATQRGVAPRQDDSASSDSESEDGAMHVVRGSGVQSDGLNESREDFAALRRCLIMGKRLNTAVRQGHTRTYQRAHGGQATFRIHPSSTLLLTANAASAAGGPQSAGLPMVVYFEDLVFTSQLFARTVSAAEPSWLTDMTSELRNRQSLQ